MGQHTNSYGTSRCNGATWRGVLTISLGVLVGLTMMRPEAARAQTFSVLHEFTESDGANPTAGLTIAGAGTFYGTTGLGGTQGGGVAFKLAQRGSGWILTPLYEFDCKCKLPARGRIDDRPGRVLYGSNTDNGRGGSVYELQPPSSACKTALCYWSESVLYNVNGVGWIPAQQRQRDLRSGGKYLRHDERGIQR